MNTFSNAALFLAIVLTECASPAQDPTVESDKSRLFNGISNSDERAFDEVSRLPIERAAPLLLAYVDDASTNLQRALRARKTIRQIPGFSIYMKRRILEKRTRAGGEYDMVEFQLLGAIGGQESAAAVAPFLFVDDPTLVVADDYAAGPINWMALEALEKMHLPDAPADRSFPGYTAPDLSDWKAWAEKKGYRDEKIPPLITLAQKGVSPEAIARSNAILAGGGASPTVTPSAEQTQSVKPSGESPPPLPSPSDSAKRASPAAEAPASATEHLRRAPLWPWIVGTLGLFVIIAIVLKRRA